METTLYMKYGSRVTSGMAECLYDRLLDDPELAPFFEAVDIDRLREHVADFLSVLTGGPDMYRGRDLREAHSDYRITAAHFEMVMAHIAAAIRGYEADVVSG
jgi:hemoglobin